MKVIQTQAVCLVPTDFEISSKGWKGLVTNKVSGK